MRCEFCNDCHNRAVCNTLCPEAELYVNQDFVPQTERPSGILNDRNIKDWPENEELVFTPQQREIVRLLARGKTKLEVREILGISRQHINEQLARLKKRFK